MENAHGFLSLRYFIYIHPLKDQNKNKLKLVSSFVPQ